jgi:hypothetical protein
MGIIFCLMLTCYKTASATHFFLVSFILEGWQNEGMKFYEQMSSVEQERVALESIGGSIAIEGMQEAAQVCWDQLKTLKNSLYEQSTTIVQGSNQRKLEPTESNPLLSKHDE